MINFKWAARAAGSVSSSSSRVSSKSRSQGARVFCSSSSSRAAVQSPGIAPSSGSENASSEPPFKQVATSRFFPEMDIGNPTPPR